MTTSNLDRIGKGLRILLTGLSPYVKRQLKAVYGDRWWSQGAAPNVSRLPELKNRLAKAENDDARFEMLDIAALLTIVNNVWGDAFQADLGHAGRSYVNELRDVRNKWAHQDMLTPDDAYRAFDTMNRLLEMIAAPQRTETAEMTRKLWAEIKAEDKASQPTLLVTASGAIPSLKPWREVATPHPDVATGRFQQAEFAADLFQVITGRASSEYKEPKEFFQRTYFTEGLSQLLARAWLRLSGEGGDPVVELQTNFGGGKTHSLLALYHLFGGKINKSNIQGLENIYAQAKNLPSALPVSNRAVLPCNYLSVDTPWKKADGTRIQTLWGELAWQLGESAGGKGKQAFALVAEADRRSVSPGGEKLTQLFEEFGPALILIDEWVVYARQLIGKQDLPAGSFDVGMSFVQALTEAAKTAGNTLVVAAIPASDNEVGGEHGRIALERIRNVFGRVEAIWKPASAEEAFEIVRRRLFEPLSEKALKERDAVCRSFGEMYRENRGDFPQECREGVYEERLKSAYPIHPELFDRLYQDWSTLERFQLTRGVLRLMASVIYELWVRGDKSLLIMPGNLPLDSQVIRVEFTRHLPDGWAAVLDKDIDGPASRPFAMDSEPSHLGRYSACRRVARTVFVGSAPTTAAQRVRGLEEVRVKLGCAQPGESIPTFGDALRRLSEQLHYLYSEANRYWFDTHITIARQAADRAAQFERKPELVEDEITRRVKDLARRERTELSGIHPIPADSSDVPDEAICRLVILGVKQGHRSRNGSSGESVALKAAREILEHRGNSPRLYRNMLVFLAPDVERLLELEQATRNWLAWTSIEQEKEQLNLDAAQIRQADKQIKTQNERIDALLLETYVHLIVPEQEGTAPVELTVTRVSGDNLVGRVVRKLKSEEQIIIEWAPALLRMELDRWLWKETNHIGVRQLWEYLAQYVYLSRLRDQDVLANAIRNGVGSFSWADNFAYASTINDKGKYVGLVTSQIPSVAFDNNSLLVKPEVAKKQIEEELAEKEKEYQQPTEGLPGDQIGEGKSSELVKQEKIMRRFHGSVELDPTRVGRDAGRIADEILAHLTSLVGAKAKITLEINVEVPDGIPEDRVRIVSENCNTLKFKGHEFEKG